MTWEELVKEEFTKAGKPEPCNEECAFLLWEYTAFPFVDEKTVRSQIRDVIAQGGEEHPTPTTGGTAE